jgi:hypothetical protein
MNPKIPKLQLPSYSSVTSSLFTPYPVYKSLSKNDFPLFLRGDIILTNNRRSWFAKLIRFAGRLRGGDPTVNHAEMYLASGRAFSADVKMCIHDIERYFKGNHDIYFYRCVELDNIDRDRLVAEAMRWKGKSYDVLGILWQALDAITGDSYSKKHNTDVLAYCSELLQRIYWKAVKRKVSKKAIGAATPDNIEVYIDKSKLWKQIFVLKKEKGKWLIHWDW